MTKFLSGILIITIISICSCSEKKSPIADNTKDRISLLEADKSFSDLSAKSGMKAAFVEYIDSNGVLLRSDNVPIAGAMAIDYLIQFNDTGFNLIWQPHHAVVAKSGDLGYTYGIYSVTIPSSDTTIYGNYVHIWKKNLKGNWKFVLDSGNEGIGEQ